MIYFLIVELLFLIIFTTLFSIRNPLNEQKLIKELNFGSIKKVDYFYSKTSSELIIFLSTNNHFVNSLFRVYKHFVKFIFITYMFISFIFFA